MWKRWLLPLLSLGMCLINAGVLLASLAQPERGSLVGQGLMTLFWLALAVLSFRGFSAKKEHSQDEDRTER